MDHHSHKQQRSNLSSVPPITGRRNTKENNLPLCGLTGLLLSIVFTQTGIMERPQELYLGSIFICFDIGIGIFQYLQWPFPWVLLKESYGLQKHSGCACCRSWVFPTTTGDWVLLETGTNPIRFPSTVLWGPPLLNSAARLTFSSVSPFCALLWIHPVKLSLSGKVLIPPCLPWS